MLGWYKKQARRRVDTTKASRYINVMGGTRGAMDRQAVLVVGLLQSYAAVQAWACQAAHQR